MSCNPWVVGSSPTRPTTRQYAGTRRQPLDAPSIATKLRVRRLEGYGSDGPFTDETRTIYRLGAALSHLIDLPTCSFARSPLRATTSGGRSRGRVGAMGRYLSGRTLVMACPLVGCSG